MGISCNFLGYEVNAADKDKITKIAFNLSTDPWENEDSASDFVNIEVGNQFSIESFLKCTTKGNGSFQGFIKEYKGLAFESEDPSIAEITQDTYGVVEAVTVGTTKIIVSYPKIKSIELTVNVVEKGSIDKEGTYQKVNRKVEKLYATKIKTSNVVSYYSTLGSFSKYDFSNSKHDILFSNQYQVNLMYGNLSEHLKKNNAIYKTYTPLKISGVSDVSKSSIKIKLSRKLTDNDVVAYCMINDVKYSKNLKMKFRAIFVEGSKAASDPHGPYKYVNDVDIKLSKGENEFSVKLPKEIKAGKTYSVLFSIDETYGFTWTKGKTFQAK